MRYMPQGSTKFNSERVIETICFASCVWEASWVEAFRDNAGGNVGTALTVEHKFKSEE